MNGARVAITIVVLLGVARTVVAQQSALDEILRRERIAQIQNYRTTIEQTRQLLQSGATDYRVRGAFATAADIADQLTSQLAQVAAISDASLLERGYQQWQGIDQHALVDSAIVFARFLAEKHIVFDERMMRPWQRFAQTIVGIVQANGNAPFDRVEDLPRLKAELWHLRFVHSVRGAQERIDRTEAAIQSLEARLAQQQEADRITATLRANIAAGKTDAALEQRIAALPEDLRVSVEAARREAEESKARKLAQAQEEQRRQEAALKRQREIDEAIRLRKEEIETGKSNPVAERQRRADPGLAQSVKVWEEAYRQEQAERKAAEAKRKLAEIERAKAEEQQRRESEAAKQRAREEADRLAALVRKYDIKGIIDFRELVANPFQYRNQTMILQGARFVRMMSSTAGILVVGRDQQIYVSRLPSNLFSRPNESTPLVVRVQGFAEGTNAFGASIQVPHVEYVAVWPGGRVE